MISLEEIERFKEEYMEKVRAALEVHAGVIPGEPMEEYTRRWVVTSKMWQAIQDGDQEALQEYLDIQGAASNYALFRMNPSVVNWVKMEWVWF